MQWSGHGRAQADHTAAPRRYARTAVVRAFDYTRYQPHVSQDRHVTDEADIEQAIISTRVGTDAKRTADARSVRNRQQHDAPLDALTVDVDANGPRPVAHERTQQRGDVQHTAGHETNASHAVHAPHAADDFDIDAGTDRVHEVLRDALPACAPDVVRPDRAACQGGDRVLTRVCTRNHFDEVVARTNRDQAERRVGRLRCQDAVRHFMDGPVAAGGDDASLARARGSLRELRRVPGAFGLHHLESQTRTLQRVLDLWPQAAACAVTGHGIEDHAHGQMVVGGGRSGQFAWFEDLFLFHIPDS